METLKRPVKSKRKLLFICIWYLILMGGFQMGYTQNPPDKPELNFQRIQEELVSNTVLDIYQDKFGFIWIGTNSGLQRFDGIEFHTYTTNKKDTTSLGDNFVMDVYEDKDSVLWVRTRTGMSRYNRSTNDFTNFPVPENPDLFNNNKLVEEDSENTLWVIGGEEKLFYYDREQQTFIAKGNFKDKDLSSIQAGQNSILWLTTLNNGLIKFDTESYTVKQTYTHDPSDPNSIGSDRLNTLERDSEGVFWIGTNDAGLNKMVLEDGDVHFIKYKHNPDDPYSLTNNDVFSINIDRQGSLWIGNENGGLHLFNPEEDNFFRYVNDRKDPNSLSSNSIYCFFEDETGRYWVGTGLNGLNLVDPYASKFKHYTTSAAKENWLTNGVIRDFYEEENGDIWIATDGGGLNHFNRSEESFKAYEYDSGNPFSLRSDAVLGIEKDESGRLWVSTWGGGINILVDEDQEKFISFQQFIGNSRYPFENVFDVHFDSQYDYIWIAAHAEGLYRYNPGSGELRLFSADSEKSNSLSSNTIQNIFEDSKGNLWISANFGLNLLRAEDKDKENGNFTVFRYEENDSTSLPNDVVRDVYEDSRNNIWVATKSGLAKYVEEKNQFIIYDKSDGLPTNEVRSIIESDDKNLWIGTINGLAKFNPETETFKNYYRSDGLQADKFSRHTVLKLKSGELLFGGINGFNLFHPDNIYKNPHIPPVYLSDFRLYNKSVSIKDKDSPLHQHISMTDSLVLSHRDNVFTFEFVALNYTKPKQNQYAYKLEGFEENWNYVGNQRYATYTNLDPGEYTFRVKAANNDGVWNEKGVSLALTITPPFWQTAWFYLLSGLFVIGTIFTIYRMRVRSIREHNKRLEKEVEERTHELKGKNEDLESALHELKKTRSELVQKAHKAGMADVATGVLHNVGNILNSINVSTSIIDDTIRNTRLGNLKQANEMLREHLDDIENFIVNNPRGKLLLEYYMKVEEPLEKEYEILKTQKDRLQEKVNLVVEVIAAQQDFSKADVVKEKTNIREVCEDALTLQAGSIERHDLIIEKDYDLVDPVAIEKTKVMHILFNLFKNAKEAMKQADVEDRIMTISCRQDDEYVHLSVSDNGIGISEKELNKIFTHGFTTKKQGHGFGLHSCANYMKEMGGKIRVDSDGLGEGATFTLSFPREGEPDGSPQKKEYPGLQKTGEKGIAEL